MFRDKPDTQRRYFKTPLALDGPMMSIRRFAVELLTVQDLIQLGSMTDGAAQLLEAVVRNRMNVSRLSAKKKLLPGM